MVKPAQTRGVGRGGSKSNNAAALTRSARAKATGKTALGKRTRSNSRPESGIAVDPSRDSSLEGSDQPFKRFRKDNAVAGPSSTVLAPPTGLDLTVGPKSRSRKRPKLDASTPTQVKKGTADSSDSPSLILTMPLEIFTEILLNTSLKDILAVSRTCTALRTSLLLPSSAFIWKHARLHITDRHNFRGYLNPSIGHQNDPVAYEKKLQKRTDDVAATLKVPDWEEEQYGGGSECGFFKSEAEYAAFVYEDGGACEVCGEKGAFLSYALRITLCKKDSCKTILVRDHIRRMADLWQTDPDHYETYPNLYPRMEVYLRTDRFPDTRASRTLAARRKLIVAGELCRKRHPRLEALIDENKGKEGGVEVINKETERNEKWMKLCHALFDWRRQTRNFYHENKKVNLALAESFALKHNTTAEDLLNCTSFGAYYHNKNQIHEPISEIDYAVFAPTISAQLAAIAKKRATRAQDQVYHTFQTQIIMLHKHLVRLAKVAHIKNTGTASAASKGSGSEKGNFEGENLLPIVPALSAFKEMPIMKMLQATQVPLDVDMMFSVGNTIATKGAGKKTEKGGGTSAGANWKTVVAGQVKGNEVKQSLKNDGMVGMMIRDQVRKWVSDARVGLGRVLLGSAAEGVEGASAKAATNAANGVFARWRCKKCTYFPPKYVEDECFDFEGACAHECFGSGRERPSDRRAKKAKWDVANFERDDRAMAALKRMNEMMKEALNNPGLDKEESACHPNIASQFFALCKSCDPPVVVRWKGLVGHSHRHEDDIQVEYGPSQDFPAYPVPDDGTTQRLLKAKAKSKSRGKKLDKGALDNGEEKGKGKGKAKEVGNDEDKGLEKSVEAERIVACRYCYNSALVEAAKVAETTNPVLVPAQGSVVEADPVILAADGESGNDGGNPAMVKEPLELEPSAWLTFNGMRSHLNSRHGIYSIRDEDYFMKKGMPEGVEGGLKG
ncbi:hypothetical protein DFP72DRAFT_871129 [Ephemerocybe angulata]|uniref:F-box domain-containing protein n=1 Tax=Ephemerocybe angulata TaxID=980116 RepID=A0A8H6IFV8_9AGAR|nr:hypothetical protein DFP72DRAFT_871129 [Tulosesus angulatus]